MYSPLLMKTFRETAKHVPKYPKNAQNMLKQKNTLKRGAVPPFLMLHGPLETTSKYTL